MVSYIQTLLSQLNDVDVNDASMTKTLEPVGKDDRVLGVCPDDLKRLKVHIHRIGDRGAALNKQQRILMIQHEGEETPPDGFVQLGAEAQLLHEEHEMLDKLFWFALRQHFSGKGGDAATIGIRQNWQVVSSTGTESLPEVIKAILKILKDTK